MFVSSIISCVTWQVKSDAGHLAEVKFFVGFTEVIEGCIDFVFWDSVPLCVVGLDNFDVLLDANLGVWLAVGPEGLLDIVGG